MNFAAAYVLMFLVLIAGICLFVGLGRLLVAVNDRMTERFFPSVAYERICADGASKGGAHSA